LRFSVQATKRPLLQRQIDAVDQQSDPLLYELHGLMEAEIKIVESS
jgi:hypothetical protein